MLVCRSLVGVFIALAIPSLAEAGPAAPLFLPSGPVLTIVSADPIEVGASRGQTQTTAFISILNAGDETAEISVEFQASTANVNVASVNPDSIDPETAERVGVTLEHPSDLDETIEGQFVVTSAGPPIAQPVTILPGSTTRSDYWAHGIVIGALLAGLGVGLVIALALMMWKGRRVLLLGAPGPEWSFDSWATTLTGAGALLGIVLAGVAFPDTPSEVDEDTLLILSAFFGLLVVIAPFVFLSIRSPGSAADQSALWGFNGTLLLACSLTLVAVLGQLATLALLFWELLEGGMLGEVAIGAAAGLGVLALVYFMFTAPSLASTDWKTEQEGADAETKQYYIDVIRAALEPKFQGLLKREAGAEGPRRPSPQPRWKLP